MRTILVLLVLAAGALLAALLYWTPAAPPREVVVRPAPALDIETQQVKLDFGTSPGTTAGADVSNPDTASSSAPTSPETAPGDPGVMPNEQILGFFNAADRAAFIRAARKHGIEIVGELSIGNAVRVRYTDAAAYARARAEAPQPLRASANHRVRLPPDPSQEPRTSDGNYVGFGDRTLEWLGVSTDNSVWGKGVTVAVLDTAVGRHPSIDEARIRRVNPFGIDTEGANSFHGTAVASLIVGNGHGVNGLAPSATVLSIPVVGGESGGDSFTLAQGIAEAVTLGADVINLSLASSGDSFIVQQAIQHALDNGVAVVASVGNDAVDGVAFPARYNGVIAVGAVDASARHLYFSNTGPEVDVTAPGLGITAAGDGEQVIAFSGTSSAAPIVSGMIAALRSLSPGMSTQNAASLLTGYGDDFGAPGPDNAYGGGILNVQRLLQRNEPAIFDVRAGVPYIVNPTDVSQDLRIEFYAQNSGTEAIGDMTIRVDIEGVVTTLHFSNVGVGQTVSEQVTIPAGSVPENGRIVASHAAVINGHEDVNPGDNARRVSFTLQTD